MDCKTLLSKDGYIINKKKYDIKVIDKLKADLTVEPFQFGISFGVKDTNDFFKVYRETDDIISIPKFYGLEKFGPPEKNKEIIGAPVKINFKGELRQAQQELIDTVMPILNEKNGGLICLGCGGGKCLGKDTKILMYDGSIKLVQNIRIGDTLMGDDSMPRYVLSIARGKEMMYKIESLNESYIVNESHILSLDYNRKIIDISVKDYLTHPNKDVFKGYRVPINFNQQPIEIDPYILGFWLGSFDKKDMNTYIYHNTTSSNIFNNFLKKYNLIENKYIPLHYKCNSRNIQVALLNGITAATGYYNHDHYQLRIFDKILFDDVIYLARSLGMVVYKFKNSLHIYDKLESTLTYKITVNKLDIDTYYGFEIDNNRRFVLGDFTVTHNTVLALKIASIFNVKTLIIVHKSFLLNQWKERIGQFTDSSVGIIQRDKIDVDDKPFVIGMLQSIAKEKYDYNIFADFGLVIFDEAHHAPSKYFSKALPLINCKKTLALSATPKRSDKLEKVLHWYLGPIIYKNELEENKTVLVKLYNYNIVHEKFVEKKQRFTGQVNRPGTVSNIITIGRRNRFIIDLVEDILLEDGRKILILSERVEHLELLKKRLNERCPGVTTGYYIGGLKQKKLDESAQCNVIFGTFQMASEALDIKGLNTLVMATARREIEQAIGRITRDPNTLIRPLVIDIIDNLDSFTRQGYYRRSFYRKSRFQIYNLNVEDNEIINEEDITIIYNTKESKITQSNIDDVDFID